jgi:aspartate ammonia-lyase
VQGVVTALLPRIGYAHASAAAQRALRTGKGVADVIVEMGLLTAEEVCPGPGGDNGIAKI